ncbi:MAG: helix-hairpin-helix domain-containing protein [Synechococcus sp.]|nr:helix-hairpin-helix domain-containing protein [Synechococcus sp.]
MNFLRKRQLQQRLQQDPYYRLQSLEEVTLAASLGIKIDVNRATIDDWLRLPGISIHQGRSLVQLTDQGVQFYSLDDVAAALGISVQRLQPLAPVLSFAYYAPELALPQININGASLEELTAFGVNATLAFAIIQERQRGNYRHFADLQARLKLPSQQIMAWLHQFRFS